MASLSIPFQDLINNFATPPRDQEDENKNKKKSFIDTFKSAKDTIEKAKKIIGMVKNPTLLVPLIVVIVTILIAILFGGGSASGLGAISGGDQDAPQPSTQPVIKIPGLNLKLEGPNSINNGELLEYTITVSYDSSQSTTPLSDIEIYEVIPQNTSLEKADGAYTLDGNTIYWPMSQNSNSFSFVLRPTTPDIEVKNTVYAKVAASSSGSNPTVNSCNGSYDLTSNPLGANFGDPDCNFNKDELYSLLKSLDPSNADGWYFKLIYCETGGTYNSNAFNPVSTSGTAWGLYQMGHKEYSELGITRQMNNEFDRGDVEWRTQSKNAVSYNNLRGNDFAYWGCKPY